MPMPPVPTAIKSRVQQLTRQGKSIRRIQKLIQSEFGRSVSFGTVQTVQNQESDIPSVVSDKKNGRFEWRKAAAWAAEGQKLKQEASSSQDFANIKLGKGESIILLPFSDQHIGAWGADYESFTRMTDDILKCPNLYVALLGDYLEYAIKLRSVLETTAQILPPDAQADFLEDWLMEIKPKVAWATWDNHGVEREERQSGTSTIKRILSKHVVYHNGIGHADVQVGKQVYRIASSHRFKQGSSMLDPCSAQRRYMRFEGIDREITMQGDTHKPGMAVYHDGPMKRVALNAGTLHVNSGYAKRYFSLFTSSAYPCLVLESDTHNIIPFWNLQDAMKYLGIARK
jgi:hypothetical protein